MAPRGEIGEKRDWREMVDEEGGCEREVDEERRWRDGRYIVIRREVVESGSGVCMEV